MKRQTIQAVRAILGLALGLAYGFSARGDTNSWSSPDSGKWESDTNWSLGVAPGPTQTILLTNAGADLVIGTNVSFPLKRLTIDATTSANFTNTLTITNLIVVGADTNVINEVRLDGAGTNKPLHILSQVSLATGGLLTVSNSSLQIDGTLNVGLPGPSDFVATDLPPNFVLESGVARVRNVLIGALSNSLGVLNLTGGTLLVTNGVLGIGNDGSTNHGSGTGVVTVDSATLTVATLNLGSSAGGLGSLTIQGSASVNVRSNLVVVSGSPSNTSSISITGGSLIATNGLVQVGPIGHGEMLISGGNHVVRQLRLGSTDGSGTGYLYLSGGSLRILGTGSGPGQGFVANLIVVDGDFNATGTSLTIGSHDYDAAAYLAGKANVQCDAVYVGNSPGFTGTCTQTGGVMNVYKQMIVGDNCPNGANGAVGHETLGGGTLYVTNATHTAVLDVRNGTFELKPGGTLVVDKLVLTNSCGHFLTNGGVMLSSDGRFLGGSLVTGNLLLNPGAETTDLTDWTPGGNDPSSVVADDGSLSAITPHSGNWEFAGGGVEGTLSQVVSLVGNQGISAAAIDTGKLLASISFWENGYDINPPGGNDDATVMVEFLDANSNTLFTRTTPEIDSGVWSNYTANYVITNGTRSIRYTMAFGISVVAAMDDNWLMVSFPPFLDLAVAGTDVLLTWPAWGTNYLLESTTDLSLPKSWQTVTADPVLGPDGLVVTDALYGPARFYRLRSK